MWDRSTSRVVLVFVAIGVVAACSDAADTPPGSAESDSGAGNRGSGGSGAGKGGGGGTGAQSGAGGGGAQGAAGGTSGAGGANGGAGVSGGNGSSGASGASGKGGSSGTGSGGSSGQGSGGTTGSGTGGASGTGGSSGTGGNAGSAACNTESKFNGQATWYELATPLVNCSYETGTLPQYYAALNTAQYGASAACGACAHVEGPKGSVDVQIVDQCPIATNPICYQGHLDLNVPAFERIADKVTGIVPIRWWFTPCTVQGGVSYRFKEGTSQYWAAVQVRNHRHRITKLEYRNSSGSFVDMPRQDYNYFLAASGMGPGPFTFRVTNVHGHSIVDSNIPLRVAQVVSGAAQFPSCN